MLYIRARARRMSLLRAVRIARRYDSALRRVVARAAQRFVVMLSRAQRCHAAYDAFARFVLPPLDYAVFSPDD